jgi:YHS domain-containing protein
MLAITGKILAEELAVRQPTQSEIGKTVTCPVMNSKFEVTRSTPVIDYKGMSYYFCCEPCVKEFKANPGKYAAAGELIVRQPTQSEIGKVTTCPVMKGKFEVTKSTPVIDYEGKSYYFCCESCIDEFKKNPDKYAK